MVFGAVLFMTQLCWAKRSKTVFILLVCNDDQHYKRRRPSLLNHTCVEIVSLLFRNTEMSALKLVTDTNMTAYSVPR